MIDSILSWIHPSYVFALALVTRVSSELLTANLVFLITYILPWGLSCITIWMTLLAGNHHPRAWLLGLLNQALWLVWMLTTGTWGLLPLNAVLWVVYGRNHLKWKLEQSPSITVVKTKLSDEDAAELRRLVDTAHRVHLVAADAAS